MVKSHPENTVGVWGPSRACEEGHTLPLHYCMLSPPASFRGLGPPPLCCTQWDKSGFPLKRTSPRDPGVT